MKTTHDATNDNKTIESKLHSQSHVHCEYKVQTQKRIQITWMLLEE